MNNGLKVRDFLSHGEIRQLRRKSDARGAWLVLHAWGVVAAMMALYAAYPHPLVLGAGLFVIAGRQLGMAVLMHDASHGLLFHTRWLNDFAGQWLCGAPAGADMYAYRPYHMAHHRNTQQPDDPDLSLSAPFPISRASLARKMLRDMIGWTFLRNRLFLLRVSLGKEFSRKERAVRLWRTTGGLLVSNLVMAAGFLAAGRIDLYLLLWLLPLVTTYSVVIRVRNIAEHAMIADNNNPLQNTRTTRAGLLERAILAPYWVNYHIEHHLFVFVPCFRLRQAHALLMAKGYGKKMEMRDGYGAVLALAAPKTLA